MTKKRKKKTDAVEILYDLLIKGKPEMEAMLEEARGEMEIAEKIYLLRTEAGLTQRELAERVRTSSSVISRLESADYDGHSLSMLKRIAKALGQRVEIHFVPIEGTEAA